MGEDSPLEAQREGDSDGRMKKRQEGEMKRIDLINNLSKRADIPVKVSGFIVKLMFNMIREALIRGDIVELRGFGKFTTNSYQERIGRNPKTDTSVIVKSTRLPKFSMGSKMKRRLNPGKNIR